MSQVLGAPDESFAGVDAIERQYGHFGTQPVEALGLLVFAVESAQKRPSASRRISGQQPLDHFAVDVGEPEIAALETVGQLLMA